MEFGKSLRIAREAKGFTVDQLAEITHLAPTTIESLEKEDFSHIPAPIYGRGFVKLYCSGVGLEPKPFIDEFMDTLNGGRETHIRERAVAVETAAPAPQPENPAPPPPPATEEPVEAEEAPPPLQDLFSQQQAVQDDDGKPTLSRYATEYHVDHDETSFPFLSNIGRLAILAVGALAVIFLLGWGVRALYRLTMPHAQAEEPQSTAAETVPAAPRVPQEIPALYLD